MCKLFEILFAETIGGHSRSNVEIMVADSFEKASEYADGRIANYFGEGETVVVDEGIAEDLDCSQEVKLKSISEFGSIEVCCLICNSCGSGEKTVVQCRCKEYLCQDCEDIHICEEEV